MRKLRDAFERGRHRVRNTLQHQRQKRRQRERAPKHSPLRERINRALDALELKLAHRKKERKKAFRRWHRQRREQGAVTMYDSIDVGEIPSTAKAVAGYTSGFWPTFKSLAARFPKAHRLSIAVTASQDAQCLDVEPGDATPAQAPGWVKRQHARGVKRPVVYSSLSQMATVLSALSRAGVDRDEVRVWTAHYNGQPHRCSPKCGFGLRTVADATQYTDHALGRNLDASLCSGRFFSK
jgi:hypothetical protein